MNEMQVNVTYATEFQGVIDCRGVDARIVFRLGGGEDVAPRFARLLAGIKNCSTAFAPILVSLY